MSKELAAVIFDLDGVIADTVGLHYIANKKVADLLGLPFAEIDNHRYKGISRTDIIKDMAARSVKTLGQQELHELAEAKNHHYQQLIRDMDEQAILPGMKHFLEQLKAEGIRTALASSSTNGSVVLEQTGLMEYFDRIVDPASLAKGKPDPEIFLRAAEGLGVPPSNCAAIEDGAAGLRAILQAGMFSVAVGNDVKDEPADWHVETTAEITLNELMRRFKG